MSLSINYNTLSVLDQFHLLIILNLGHTFWFYGMPGYIWMLAIVNLTLVGGGYF